MKKNVTKILNDINKKRNNWIKANQENNFEKGIQRILLGLYPDQAHFIFEVLQNAEDAGASTVRFDLTRDELTVQHNGSRLFSAKDVESITGIGESAKKDDGGKIGKFGIGFKAVFAYSNTPRIYSGEYNFEIRDLICPYEIPTIQKIDQETIFSFPFNNPSKPKDLCFREIKTAFESLDHTILLFLRNIGKIEWKTDEGESGFYIRSFKRIESARHITIVGNHNNDKKEGIWIVFEKAINDPDGNSVKPIEIAYKVKKKEIKGKGKGKNNIKKMESVVCLHQSPLFVFFATEKETRLGFLLQGPFKTTPARDNIPKDDPWNAYLLDESANLIVDSLRQLKSMKLLSVSVLEAMPIIEENFLPNTMFRVIYDAVAKSLAENKLLPTENGRYTNAANAVIGRDKSIRKLLSSDQLTELFGDDSCGKIDKLQWLSEEITATRTPYLRDYLMREMAINEIDPEKFSAKVTGDFFENQSDEWLVDLYKFLLDHKGLWRAPRFEYDSCGVMRKKPFVRLQNNHQASAFESDGTTAAVYLPSKSNKNYPCIKRNLLFHNETKEFFRDLGIKEPDIVSDVIKNILPYYESNNVKISKKNHMKHIALIRQSLKINLMDRRSVLISKLKNSSFLFARNAASDEKSLKRPEDIYLKNDGLDIFFRNNPDIWFLDASYSKRMIDDFRDLGIRDDIKICQRSSDSRGYVIVNDSRGKHERGRDGFDPKCWVDGLDFAILNPNIQRSLFIWINIAYRLRNQIQGTIERSSTQTYEYSDTRKISSRIGNALLSSAWLPDTKRKFHKPDEISLDDLPEEFERYDDLANQFQMKGSELNDLAQKAGFDSRDLDFLRKIKSIPSDVRQRIEKQVVDAMRTRPAFPERASSNPDRRSRRAMTRADEAPEKKSEKRSRRVKISSPIGDKKAYLREIYTNEGELFCQICENVDAKPFRVRDNEYYFEAVQIFDDFAKEHEAAHIALCPLCAAKFKVFIKDDKNQCQRLWNDLVDLDIETADELRVWLDLGEEKKSIRFVETHLIDVRQILKVEGKGRKDPSS